MIKYISIFCIFLLMILPGCRMSLSFTGASISPDIKTVSVQYFPNNAPLVNPTLSQDFTETLKDRFLTQTSLQLIRNSGDLNFEGEITQYEIRPMAIQQNETAALNRLSVSVRVKYSNEKNHAQDFDMSFSAYEEYESTKNLSDVESELAKRIIDKLTEQVFNKAVVNW